jgi:hypothetical protein
MIVVDIPEGDDFIERIKSARFIGGSVPSPLMFFHAELGSNSLIYNPWADSDAYAAIQELKKCVATHVRK